MLRIEIKNVKQTIKKFGYCIGICKDAAMKIKTASQTGLKPESFV